MSSFFFHRPPTTAIYTLSLHDALPISELGSVRIGAPPLGDVARGAGDRRSRRLEQLRHVGRRDRKSTCLNSSHITISYAVFCLKKKKKRKSNKHTHGHEPPTQLSTTEN